MVDANDESDGSTDTSGCSCCIEILEPRLEASVEQAYGAAGLDALMSGDVIGPDWVIGPG